MNTNANEPSKCPNCGKPMPAGALAGLCPACLLDQGVETEPADTADHGRFQAPPLETIAGLFPGLEIIGLLGAGGMGAVYQARQPSLDRRVALKVLPAGGRVGSAERFNREARALARLSHPNIVAVHEFGQVVGLHFFIMEFVDGANLRQLEKTSRLSPREALEIIPQICDALQYAHDEGVVHRDIKPENVLIDRKGRVKIADFGLAKIADPDPDALRLTVEGQVMGTPHYMAPEQVERPLSVDHRADIYALGVVFYEMLTGDLPIGKFSPPSRKVEVDVRLDDIVLRALENDPERRYQQAGQVKSEVETVTGNPRPGVATVASVADPADIELDERLVRWLGIPVAMVSSGGRWRLLPGTFAATFVVMICAGLAHTFVRLAAGREHVLSTWVVLTGLIIAVFGIRQAISRSDPSEGRGIGRRAALDSLWLVGLVSFIVGSHFGMVHWVDARRAGFGWNMMQVAKLDPATRALAVTLGNGTTIELLAMARGDEAPNQWTRPDGTPLPDTVFDVHGLPEMLNNTRPTTRFILKESGSSRALGTAVYEFSPGATVSAGGVVWKNGEKLEDGWPILAAWAYETNRATLRFGLRYERWRTIAALTPGDPPRVQTWSQTGEPKWISNFNHISDDGTNTYVTAVLNRDTKNWRMRIVAVDTEGREHQYSQGNISPIENAATWTCTFANLTRNRIKEIQVQAQPVHWIEFRDVLLDFKGSLRRESRFGPEQTISFGELLDLDTGRTGSFPADDHERVAGVFAGVDRNIAWMQEQGFDVEARPAALGLLGVRHVRLEADDWKRITPHELADRLRLTGSMQTELKPGPEGPVVGFTTREGGTGMFRLIGFSEQPTMFQLEIKRAMK